MARRWQTVGIVLTSLFVAIVVGVLLMRDDHNSLFSEVQVCDRRAVVGRNLVCLD